MRTTLRKKYILVGTFMIVSFLGMLFLLAASLQNTLVTNWNRLSMEKVARQAVDYLNAVKWEKGKAEIDSIAFENNVSITVIDKEQQLLATTRMKEQTRGYITKNMQNILKKNEKDLLINGNHFYKNIHDETGRASFINIYVVENRGLIIVRKSISGLRSSMRVMEVCYAAAAVLLLVLGILVLLWLSRKMTKPIVNISRVTGKIANLDFSEKAEINSNDELGDLADSVNQMSDRLNKALDNLQKDVEKRKALVRNMAHEMKTPVSVIMGYAENMSGLAAGKPEKMEKYCNVIVNECERMDSIIQRMLEYSLYEEKGADALEKQRFGADDFLQRISRQFCDEFPDSAKNFTVQNEISGDIFADYHSIDEALYNFLKNAAIYGKEGGLIRLKAAENENFFCFSVYNQGELLSDEKRERIWDVFYKGDESRTRTQTGSGIGLSIVRQTALAHGGEVYASNMNDGVEFGFTIEKQK